MAAAVVIDGQVLNAASATISVFDDGLLRGDGVFEVVRLYAGTPWALDEHLERLALSARNLRLPVTLADVEDDIDLLLAHAQAGDAFLRLVVTRGGRRIALIEEVKPAPESVALATIEYAPVRLMNAIKSLSYAANMLGVRLARERHADDALFVTSDGRVLEASRASFFYAIGSSLYTPPLEDVLDSITRRHLLAVTDACERTIVIDELQDVEEAFIASTTKEVLPVHAIDDRALTGVPGPATVAAKMALCDRIETAIASGLEA